MAYLFVFVAGLAVGATLATVAVVSYITLLFRRASSLGGTDNMQITKDQWIAILTFAAGVLGILAVAPFVPENIRPYLTVGIAVINLALSVFFGFVKPIAAAFKNGLALKKS